MRWGSYSTFLRLYRDLRRILVLTENLLYLAGKSLQRRAMRNGVLITLAMSSSIIKTNYTSAQSLTPDQVTALVLGAVASYPLGTLLVRLAGFLTRDKIDAAAGGYLHLTSHYKQSRMRLHLHYLWHEVFADDPPQPEPGDGDAAPEYNPGAARAPAAPDQPPSLVRDTHDFELFAERAAPGDADWQAHDRFIRDGLMALRSPLPMGVQSARIGFHLGPVEDWYEKGFFSYEDFPAKAFVRDPLIKRARGLVDSPLKVRVRRVLASDVAPSFWYAFTVRKFSSLLGKAITRMNADAERAGFPDYFDAQHFIWPSDALDNEVRRRFDAVDVPLAERQAAARRALMREVFTDDGPTARRHLMRMFARDYAMIVDLRLRFDAAWAASRLAANPHSELDAIETAFSLRPLATRRVASLADSARAHLDLLDAFLARRPEMRDQAPYTAMQVAAHIDYRGFRSLYLEGRDPPDLEALLASTGNAARHLGLLGEVLRRVRVYHALIKMQVLDYWSVVHRMGDIP